MIIDNPRPILRQQNSKASWFGNVNLLFYAFTSVFYTRIIVTTISAPSMVNQAHFMIVPGIFLIILFTAQKQDLQQVRLVNSLLRGLLVLTIAILLSAFWNGAGIVNALASFMMLGEPLVFLAAIVCIPMTWQSFTRIKTWFMWSVAINFTLAAIQKPLIDSYILYADGFNGTDGCGGVFFVSGAGNYVSAAVSITVAIYFLQNRNVALWIRACVFLAAFWHVLFSDSKQLVFAYVAAWLLLALFSFQRIERGIKILLALVIFTLGFYWCVQNIEAFRAYTAWARPELYGADGEVWYAKFYSVRQIISNFESPFNWLFGLGPGHTVSRLGAWFLRDYASLLVPLGATTTSIGIDAREFVSEFWLTFSSSMFSPIFGWAGIWGDLGLLGLCSYIYLGSLVWRNFCWNSYLKITLYSILVLGFIFTQMEEPGYMISVAMLLGLAWQEKRLKTNMRNSHLKLGSNRVIS